MKLRDLLFVQLTVVLSVSCHHCILWQDNSSGADMPEEIVSPPFVEIGYFTSKQKVVITHTLEIEHLYDKLDNNYFRRTKRLPKDWIPKQPCLYVKYPFVNPKVPNPEKTEEYYGTFLFVDSDGMVFHIAGLGGGPDSGKQGRIMKRYKNAVFALARKHGLDF